MANRHLNWTFPISFYNTTAMTACSGYNSVISKIQVPLKVITMSKLLLSLTDTDVSLT